MNRDPMAQRSYETAELRLWSAVLDDAIRLYVNYAEHRWGRSRLEQERRVDWSEARDWLFSDRTDQGSFVWVCQTLGLSPQYTLRLMGTATRLTKRCDAARRWVPLCRTPALLSGLDPNRRAAA